MYDIVRIHINEGNKRTAMALGGMVLMKYGYMPPKISGEVGAHIVYVNRFYAQMNFYSK